MIAQGGLLNTEWSICPQNLVNVSKKPREMLLLGNIFKILNISHILVYSKDFYKGFFGAQSCLARNTWQHPNKGV